MRVHKGREIEMSKAAEVIVMMEEAVGRIKAQYQLQPGPGPDGCYQCEGAIMPGVLTGTNTSFDVEDCDECVTYDGPLQAAFVVAQKVGGEVRFWQHDDEMVESVERRVDEGVLSPGFDMSDLVGLGFEQRAYTLPERGDDCVLTGTNPWVEIDGVEINWKHYWRVTTAFAD